MPLESMPKFMLTISKFLPLTYIVDLMKKIWLNSYVSWIKSNLTIQKDIIVLSIILIVCFGLSIYKFKWYYD